MDRFLQDRQGEVVFRARDAEVISMTGNVHLLVPRGAVVERLGDALCGERKATIWRVRFPPEVEAAWRAEGRDDEDGASGAVRDGFGHRKLRP